MVVDLGRMAPSAPLSSVPGIVAANHLLFFATIPTGAKPSQWTPWPPQCRNGCRSGPSFHQHPTRREVQLYAQRPAPRPVPFHFQAKRKIRGPMVCYEGEPVAPP